MQEVRLGENWQTSLSTCGMDLHTESLCILLYQSSIITQKNIDFYISSPLAVCQCITLLSQLLQFSDSILGYDFQFWIPDLPRQGPYESPMFLRLWSVVSLFIRLSLFKYLKERLLVFLKLCKKLKVNKVKK